MTRLASLACGVAALSLCAFGTPTAFTSLDYVQDGLVLQFDAIENAGRGTHDGATTTWRELVSGSENVTLTDGSWSANGLTFTGKVGVGKGAKHNFPSVNRTMEGYVTVPAHLPAFYFGWTRAAGDANRPGLWKEKGKWYLTYFNGGGWDSGKTVTEGDHFWSAAECTSPGDCFFQLDDVEQLATSACGSSSGTTACSLRFNAYGTSSDGNSSYGSNATYRAFRVYSRALSFKERSWNRAVDRVRFSGATLREAFNGGDEFKGYQVSEDGNTLLVDVAVTNLVAGTAKVKVGDNASGFGVKDPAAYNQPVTVTVIPQGASVTGLRVVWCGLPADATVADDGLTATFSPKAPTDLSVAVFAPTRVWTRGAGTDAFGTAANWANADGTAATAAPGADDVVFVPAAAAPGGSSSTMTWWWTSRTCASRTATLRADVP